MTNGNWWRNWLRERERDGRADADRGVYDCPYPSTDDPQEEDENMAYHQGFTNRRKELGSKFKWT